jgi:hypothetical protein
MLLQIEYTHLHAVSYLLIAHDLVLCKGFSFWPLCTTHTVFLMEEAGLGRAYSMFIYGELTERGCNWLASSPSPTSLSKHESVWDNKVGNPSS